MGLSKSKLLIEVTKMKQINNSIKISSSSIKTITKSDSNKHILYTNISSDFPNNNNTKTTEEEDSEFDDYEIYLRRSRHHRHYQQQKRHIEESDLNFSDSQTGSIPSLSTTNSMAITSSNYITDTTSNQHETEPDNIYDDYDYDDFDTEDTEDTEDNSNFVFNSYRQSIKKTTRQPIKITHLNQPQIQKGRHHSTNKYKHKIISHNHRSHNQKQRHRSSNSRHSNSLTKRNTSKPKLESPKQAKLSKTHLLPPPILTSTQYQNNESIESDLEDIEPPVHLNQQRKQINKKQTIKKPQIIDYKYKSLTRQQMGTNHFKHIENFYKQTSASMLPAPITDLSDKFSIDSASSTNENLQPKPYLVKQHTSKIANIKQFNNYQSSSSLVNKSLIPQLNVNDLYAILEPVIKPHIFDPKLQSNRLKFDLFYLGSVLIPYDTLSNASQLNRIRSSIEYYLMPNNEFMLKNEDLNLVSNSTVVLEILADYIKLTSYMNDCATKVIYSKSEIGFCGKVKENRQYFALIILKESKTTEDSELKKSITSSSCLVFRLADSSIDYIMNEISYIYRNQNFIFNYKSQSPANKQKSNGGVLYSPFKQNYDLDTSGYNNYNNNNYELIEPINTNLILIKQTNDIYFNCNNSNTNSNNDLVYQLPPPPALPPALQIKNLKASKSKLRTDLVPDTDPNSKVKKVQSPLYVQQRKVRSKSRLTSPIPNNIKKPDDKKVKKNAKIETKVTSGTIAASSLMRPDKKFQRNTDHTQSIKLIKENFANLFLSKKSQNNHEATDSDLIRQIEIETNKNMLSKKEVNDDFKSRSESNHDLHSKYKY